MKKLITFLIFAITYNLHAQNDSIPISDYFGVHKISISKIESYPFDAQGKANGQTWFKIRAEDAESFDGKITVAKNSIIIESEMPGFEKITSNINSFNGGNQRSSYMGVETISSNFQGDIREAGYKRIDMQLTNRGSTGNSRIVVYKEGSVEVGAMRISGFYDVYNITSKDQDEKKIIQQEIEEIKFAKEMMGMVAMSLVQELGIKDSLPTLNKYMSLRRSERDRIASEVENYMSVDIFHEMNPFLPDSLKQRTLELREEMAKEMKDYTDRLNILEEKLKDLERD